MLVTQCWLWALRIVENPYTRNSNRLIGFRVSFSTRQESIRFRTIRFKIYWIYSWTFKLTEAFFKEDKRNRSSYKFFFCLFFWSSIVKKEENKFCLSRLYKQTKQKPITTVIHESSGHQVFVAISMFVRPKTTEIIKNQQRQIHKIQVHKHSTFFICFCWISHDEKY